MARPGTGGKKLEEVISKIATDEDLLEHLNSTEAVVVVDMYPHFCGPCEVMAGVFKRLKVDYAEAVSFVQAQTDRMNYFQAWHNKSCPMFSVWVCGVLVELVRGANSPQLERIIKEQTDLNKITKERKPIIPDIDIPQIIRPGIEFTPGAFAVTAASVSANASASDLHEGEFTVAIIKPDAMVPHIVDEILGTVKSNRFSIVKQKRLWLTVEQAQAFYAEHTDRPFFADLVQYMTSGSCLALLLRRDEAVTTWRDLLGPASAAHAREVAPRSLRALYGHAGTHNGTYGSDSPAAAQRDLELLFAPSIPALPAVPISTDVTMTVLALGPDVASSPDKVESIVARILARGYEIHKRTQVTAPREMLESWFGPCDDLDAKVVYWSEGPIEVLVIKGDDAIAHWNEMAGPADPAAARATVPRSLRAEYGTDAVRIGVWTSPDHDAAHREYGLLFPHPSNLPTRMPEVQRTLALIKPDVAGTKGDEIMERILKANFTIVEFKKFQMTLEQAQEFYVDHVGKPFYTDLTEWMASAPIYALVLEKEDAIQAWRETMGPTNAIKAREVAPDTLRAIYGTDGSKNALHGSDSPFNAAREITLLFGEGFAAPTRAFSNTNLSSRPGSSKSRPMSSKSRPASSKLLATVAAVPEGGSPTEAAPTPSTDAAPAPASPSRPASGSKSGEAPPKSPTRPPSGAEAHKSPTRPASGTEAPKSPTRPASGADGPRPPSSKKPPSSGPSRPGSRASVRKSQALLP
ncbi:hypothetical protein AMAG_13390 [Allomyces macrogynus ATCC 38327]|uniref:Nucleoside diphosphate kinase n=1 Tax=Allomyces macrogynus (strain ATCC 38327) TaxID=578462 RepID=A0A0L0T1Z2_ALLM3|nr:hypothetical protein AMAG_13390 [Allomyces macrogynus ATCC 38327]|eukprot:KNE68747.1 hypothetical protein AMAG_13390 [Allomyces macrogynus ATCC 38327]